MGGTACSLNLRQFDVYDGLLDYLNRTKNIDLHREEDGETCYCCLKSGAKNGDLVFQYSFEQAVVAATIIDPFFVHTDDAACGIQVRILDGLKSELSTDIEWQQVAVFTGKHLEVDSREIDLTPWVRGKQCFEVRYWIKSEDLQNNLAQFARTAMARRLNFGLSVVTNGKGKNPRDYTAAPKTFKNPKVSFRVEASFPPEQ